MREHIQHYASREQHAEGGADFGFALDNFAVTPVVQNRAKQTMVFEPCTQARRAFGGSPGGEQDEFRGGQARHHNGDQTDAQADVGQQAEQNAGDFFFFVGLAGHRLKAHKNMPGQRALAGQVKLKPVLVV